MLQIHASWAMSGRIHVPTAAPGSMRVVAKLSAAAILFQGLSCSLSSIDREGLPDVEQTSGPSPASDIPL